MRLTGKQSKAIDLFWNRTEPPNDGAVRFYFAWTDRGKEIPSSIIETNSDLYELLLAHKFLPIIVEMWKQDFRDGLLFLQEFDTEREALRQLAYRVFYSTFGFIPKICKYGSKKVLTNSNVSVNIKTQIE